MSERAKYNRFFSFDASGSTLPPQPHGRTKMGREQPRERCFLGFQFHTPVAVVSSASPPPPLPPPTLSARWRPSAALELGLRAQHSVTVQFVCAGVADGQTNRRHMRICAVLEQGGDARQSRARDPAGLSEPFQSISSTGKMSARSRETPFRFADDAARATKQSSGFRSQGIAPLGGRYRLRGAISVPHDQSGPTAARPSSLSHRCLLPHRASMLVMTSSRRIRYPERCTRVSMLVPGLG